MYLVVGLLLSLGILLWVVAGRWEWSIPHKWQEKLLIWKKRYLVRSRPLKYIWEVNLRESNVENHFRQVTKDLSRFGKSTSPLSIELRVGPEEGEGDKDLYKSCLQRRFPDISVDIQVAATQDRERV